MSKTAPPAPPFKLKFNPDARRRRTGRPEPRFQPNIAGQLDPLAGCPEAQVPSDHLARQVIEWVQQLDTTDLVRGYSSLGRRGYDPRSKLAVWLYASLIGVHQASKVARQMKTDAAFRLLGEGHVYSASTLREFRRNHGDFFEDAVAQTVVMAGKADLLDPAQGAVDSMRLRAHASTASIRTLKRSKKRLEELSAVDQTELSEDDAAEHERKLSKHRQAVEQCEQEQRSNLSVTNELAGLIKFPHGSSLPGHRISVAAFGAKLRLIVALLITAKGHDYGQLEELAHQSRDQIVALGLPDDAKLQLAADAGYLSSDDLQFAAANRSWVDVLIHDPATSSNRKPGKYFDRERFVIHDDGTATCPAGRAMQGPYPTKGDRRRWTGVGCADCPLKAQCTGGKQRTLTQDPALDAARAAMRERMAEPGAKERYGQRIATVEPVFSGIEEMMGYRRASSRLAKTVRAEILLKALAYNLSRLAAARRGDSRVLLALFSACLDEAEIRVLAAWAPWSDDRQPRPDSATKPTQANCRPLSPLLVAPTAPPTAPSATPRSYFC